MLQGSPCMVVWERTSCDGFRRHLHSNARLLAGNRGFNRCAANRPSGRGGGSLQQGRWPSRRPPASSSKQAHRSLLWPF